MKFGYAPYRVRKERIGRYTFWVMMHQFCTAPSRGMFCTTQQEAIAEGWRHHRRYHSL